MSARWTIEDVERVKAKTSPCKKVIHNKGISANALTKHALHILDLAGFNVWRQNNAAVFDTTKKVYRKNSSTPGISDIIGFHRKTAQFIACEIKAGKDKLSKEQEVFLSSVNKAGGIGMVVRSIDDLESFLKHQKNFVQMISS